jgi:hypothetical protein
MTARGGTFVVPESAIVGASRCQKIDLKIDLRRKLACFDRHWGYAGATQAANGKSRLIQRL